MKHKYEIDCYCYNTYQMKLKTGKGFPENSYSYDGEAEALRCLAALIANKHSGIYMTEFINNEFDENSYGKDK